MAEEATSEQLQEADRLNKMLVEVLSYNLQGAERSDHIGAAEALLAYYEQTLRLHFDVYGDAVSDEGSLVVFRHAAELHLRIAEAKR